MAAILTFMDSPLVTWLQTFSSSQRLEFQEVSDGAFLLDVFLQIADREQSDGVLRTAKDLNARLQNWGTLLHNILNFYQEMLDQAVVMRLPDILSIAKDPLKDASLSSMQKLLLLLLGCAVQCIQKESYINVIKTLPFKIQEALVAQIRQVTDDPMTVVSLSSPHEGSIRYETWTSIAKSLTTERQSLDQRVVELHKECAYLRVEVEGRHGSLSPPETLEAYHMTRELNACRNKLNQLTSELEERQKQFTEQKEELDQTRSSLHKISQQNGLLSKEAKMARSYRDEIEEYKEEADKVQLYEKEILKYKDRVREMEFFKARVEELRQDNDSLMELRGRLEEQVNSSQKRSESVMDELIRSQLQMEDVIQERDNLKTHLQTLEDENSVLSSSQPSGGKGSLRRMLSYASSDFLTGSHLQLHLPLPPKGGMISDELRDSMDSRVTQLEAENDLLKENLTDTESRLDDTQRHLNKLQAETQQEFQKKMSELELQTKELRRKTSRELSKEFESKVLEIEQRSLNLKERVAQEFQSRVNQLEERNQQLQLQSEESSRQLQMMHTTVGRGKEQSARTEKLSRDLVDEREHFKEQLRLLKESHAEKVRSLERQVDALRNKAEEMEKMALVVPLNQSFSENSSLVESPARISYVNDSPQKQRSKCLKENCKKRAARPRSSSTVSQDGRPVALQRHASVIGIPTEPSRIQRGKEFEHHHHHFHHHHYDQEPCRSAPTTPVKAPLLPFNRNDRSRSSIQMKPPPRTPTDHQPFVRNGQQRATMPERRRIIQSAPQTLERPSKGMVLNSDVKKYPSNGMEHTMHRTQYLTDTDSGCATSPDHSASPESTNGNPDHCFEVFTSETIKMQMRYTGSNNGKWKAFVDKIVELQNRNQHLLLENAEMRRTLKSIRGTTDRADLMESKNLKLEVENRKLRRICESLQLSLTGKIQYDKRLYHFYSNV